MGWGGGGVGGARGGQWGGQQAPWARRGQTAGRDTRTADNCSAKRSAAEDPVCLPAASVPVASSGGRAPRRMIQHQRELAWGAEAAGHHKVKALQPAPAQPSSSGAAPASSADPAQHSPAQPSTAQHRQSQPPHPGTLPLQMPGRGSAPGWPLSAQGSWCRGPLRWPPHRARGSHRPGSRCPPPAAPGAQHPGSACGRGLPWPRHAGHSGVPQAAPGRPPAGLHPAPLRQRCMTTDKSSCPAVLLCLHDPSAAPHGLPNMLPIAPPA